MRLNKQFVICEVLLLTPMGTGVVKALAEEKTDAAPGKAHGLMNLRKPDKPRFPVTSILSGLPNPGRRIFAFGRTINWRRSAMELMTIAHPMFLGGWNKPRFTTST